MSIDSIRSCLNLYDKAADIALEEKIIADNTSGVSERSISTISTINRQMESTPIRDKKPSTLTSANLKEVIGDHALPRQRIKSLRARVLERGPNGQFRKRTTENEDSSLTQEMSPTSQASTIAQRILKEYHRGWKGFKANTACRDSAPVLTQEDRDIRSYKYKSRQINCRIGQKRLRMQEQKEREKGTDKPKNEKESPVSSAISDQGLASPESSQRKAIAHLPFIDFTPIEKDPMVISPVLHTMLFPDIDRIEDKSEKEFEKPTGKEFDVDEFFACSEDDNPFLASKIPETMFKTDPPPVLTCQTTLIGYSGNPCKALELGESETCYDREVSSYLTRKPFYSELSISDKETVSTKTRTQTGAITGKTLAYSLPVICISGGSGKKNTKKSNAMNMPRIKGRFAKKDESDCEVKKEEMPLPPLAKKPRLNAEDKPSVDWDSESLASGSFFCV